MRAMPFDPQPSPYSPETPIETLAEWLGDAVAAADFPKSQMRFRNNRWAAAVGLNNLNDAQWAQHFGRFEPLADNLPHPLALKYHGHQFRAYNPEIGDGRGFLFAQMRDGDGRLLDLGTKGSGTTPYSRTADGRLTLKGAVREILATEMLEASHGHIRIGTFQRLLAFEETEQMEALIDYCLAQFPGPQPPEDAPGREEPAIILMHQVVERMADLAASYMVAGFVHGVLNTDNINITGESFDYGPWRWLPHWDPSFTAAYFDHGGLYAFGRQPEALHWNCGQFAVALRLLADSEPLLAALNRFAPLYMEAVGRRWCWRLGVASQGVERDQQLVETKVQPDAFFFNNRGGRDAEGKLAEVLKGHDAITDTHPYWDEGAPQSMLVDEVETLWEAIAERDDWQPLEEKIRAVRRMGDAHGPAPTPWGT